MLTKSPPRIAIPLPHSSDPEYAERSIPQYEHAVKLAGANRFASRSTARPLK